jgi:hypothetical protein
MSKNLNLICSASVVLMLGLFAGAAVAGVDYAEPVGGWTYIYNGDAAAPGGGFSALDGTWSHDNGSDQWDETEIGAGRPGGILVLNEDDTTYLRLQDTGDPRDHGQDDPGSNRKVFFGHQLIDEIDQSVADEILSVHGITISFRARLSTTGSLDDYHLAGGGANDSWPSDGDGYVPHDGGKDCFGVHQEAGGDQTISFALSLATDDDEITVNGLTMNKLNGTEPSGDVDLQGDESGEVNILEIPDLTVWHEFWITIEPDTSGGGTHKVNIWVDGALTPDEFHVTAGNGGDFTESYISLGVGATPQSGAIDVDFFGYKEGIVSPARSNPEKARLIAPALGTILTDTWANLSWAPGESAVSHDVYIGENFDDVSAGAESTFQLNQPGTFLVVGFPGFPFSDGLVPGTTYYWRIDEVNEADPNSPWQGDVWNFMVAPRTAYLPDPADGAEGVDVDVTLSWTPGFGAKLHTVYFGETFDEVDGATGGQTQASTTFSPGTLTMAKTYYWRVDEFDAVETHKGDVWSFVTEGAVSEPEPANGAVDVTQTPTLTWTPGVFADTHQVYFGPDEASLELGKSGNLGDESFQPGELEWNTTYYWRVDEANDAHPDSPWTGPLWSFTTANFLIIDDMESYNDLDPADPASNRIFNAWIDGFGDPANGSLVGYENPPFAEQSIVHSGEQSMPFAYDNSAGISEATLTLTENRDWTVNGVNRLAIWYRGSSSNAPEPMYVALNDTAVVTNDNPEAAIISAWTEWSIDLQAFADQGINLSNVTSITLGFGDRSNPTAGGGAGSVFFDDIRLHAPTP